MKKTVFSLLLAATLPLGGCAAGGLAGLAGPSVVGSVLGNVLAPSTGMGGPDFQTAAVDACGAEAARYGRVTVTDIRSAGSSILHVIGTIDGNDYQRRNFACSFREDGGIADFDIG
jgi:hypothetical protein